MQDSRSEKLTDRLPDGMSLRKNYSETTSKGISTFTSRWRLMVAV